MTPADLTATRKTLGLTQTQLGEAIGVSLRAIQHYEAGTRKIPKPVALLLAHAMETLRTRRSRPMIFDEYPTLPKDWLSKRRTEQD
jgi:transcriptional regulator with XRE-family HTH domain